MVLDKRRDPIQRRIEIGGFARLHETEMAFRQIDFFVARQGPENREFRVPRWLSLAT